MKEKLAEEISKISGLDFEDVLNKIEIPPNPSFGDFAFPCFDIAKKEGKDLKEVVERFKKNLGNSQYFEASAAGGYVNFFVKDSFLVKSAFEKRVKKKGKGVVVIDMSSPNIAKPFGIGHLRSTIIGNALANILNFNGYKTIKLNFLGDWGTQFGKLIYGFKKFGNKKDLMENPIEYLHKIYVKAQSEEYEDFGRREFEKLERGDKENLELWSLFREFSLKEFKEIYKMLGVDFDVWSYESDYKEKSKKVIKEIVEKGIGVYDEGALIVDLGEEGLGVVVLQKKDGTSLYITRDLAAAIDRKKRFDFDAMIYEVGSEQRLYFKQLFEVLRRMGKKWADSCEHISHGLYLGKDGKRFATRKGKSISMREIIQSVMEKAKANLLERERLEGEELEKRARVIALSAIFYGDLKNYRENNIVFDVDRFLDFEGDTGPYLLYSYARANSITRKVKSKKREIPGKLEKAERALLKKIVEFEEAVDKAGKQRAPNVLANYTYSLAKLFNEFYHECPVLGNERQDFRLRVVEAFKETIKQSLELLGIKVLEKM